MRNKIIIGVLVVIIIVVSGASLRIISKNNLLSSVYMAKMMDSIHYKNNRNTFIEDNLWENYSVSGLQLQGQLKCENNIGKPVELAKQIGKGKIVYRFSQTDCMDCVYSSIPWIDTLSNYIGKDNIIVLSSFDNMSGLLVFGESNNINSVVLKEPENLYGSKHLKSPVFFYVDEQLRAYNFFSPDKNLPRLTKQYFNTMKRFFVK